MTGVKHFVGSLRAMPGSTGFQFAQEFYRQLQTGSSLGEAVKRARHAAARDTDDPTWLAYTVYGDPRATIGQRRRGSRWLRREWSRIESRTVPNTSFWRWSNAPFPMRTGRAPA